MTMRRLFLIAAFAAAFATPVSAQSWQDMFKSAIQSLTGGTSSESAAATAAPEPLPEKELFGSWSYQAPGDRVHGRRYARLAGDLDAQRAAALLFPAGGAATGARRRSLSPVAVSSRQCWTPIR